MTLDRRWQMIPAALLALATGACGDDSSSDGPTIDEVPMLFADAVCAGLRGCGPLFELQFGDTCAEQTTGSIENGSFAHLPAAIEAGTVVYNPGRVGACISAIDDLGCGLFSGSRIPAVCNEAIGGQIAVGEDCSIDEECEGTAHCAGTDMCPGTCTAAGKDGDDCDEDDDCADGLVCHDAQCAPLGAKGDGCGDTLPGCGGGLTCAGEDSDNGKPGICTNDADVFSGADGDSCDFAAGKFCETGLVCVIGVDTVTGALSQVCGKPVASGEPCKLSIPGHCPAGEYCDGVDPDAGSFEGTCAELPGNGRPCAVSGYPQCATGRTCVAGTCRTVLDNGGSCSDDAECFSENCAGGSCAAPEACEY